MQESVKRSRFELALTVATGLLAALILAGIAYLWVYSTREPAAEVADSFMQSLQEGNYTQALDLCSPELRRDLQGLPTMMERSNLRPSAWNFDRRQMSDASAELQGTVTLGADRKSNLTMQLAKQDNQWRITSVRFGGN